MTETKEKLNLKESLAYIFSKNPVLVLGLVIGPLAAGDTDLQNGAALSVTYFFIVIPVLVFASVIGKKLPEWSRPVCYALLSALMLVPAYFICGTFSATIYDSMGIYPTLLAVSTVPIVYSSKFAEKQNPVTALMNGICLAAGFALTALILGAAREFFGSGSLWGIKITDAVFSSAKLPFWGFILLGFMAAIINIIKDFIKKPSENTAGEEEEI